MIPHVIGHRLEGFPRPGPRSSPIELAVGQLDRNGVPCQCCDATEQFWLEARLYCLIARQRQAMWRDFVVDRLQTKKDGAALERYPSLIGAHVRMRVDALN